MSDKVQNLFTNLNQQRIAESKVTLHHNLKRMATDTTCPYVPALVGAFNHWIEGEATRGGIWMASVHPRFTRRNHLADYEGTDYIMHTVTLDVHSNIDYLLHDDPPLKTPLWTLKISTVSPLAPSRPGVRVGGLTPAEALSEYGIRQGLRFMNQVVPAMAFFNIITASDMAEELRCYPVLHRETPEQFQVHLESKVGLIEFNLYPKPFHDDYQLLIENA